MLESSSREIFACNTCRDFKRVSNGHKDVPCHECNGWPQEKREELLRVATRDRAEKPTIRMADLTAEERDIVAGWRIAHPHVHELTLLTWIEGRRYDPEKDQEFLVEARKRFRKWQFLRHSDEGRRPEWVENALRTGDLGGISTVDRQYIEGLRGQG